MAGYVLHLSEQENITLSAACLLYTSSGRSIMRRRTTRPIRPKPLMPTLIAIAEFPPNIPVRVFRRRAEMCIRDTHSSA